MVLPKYVETEWIGEGKAVLKFCREADNHTKDNDAAPAPIIFGEITCYMSSLNIREYEERVQMRYDSEFDDTADSSALDPVDVQPLDANVYICPPEVSPDVWRGWLIHWEAWKDIYIPLSWIQKHRDQCKPLNVEWHDSYVSEYPWIVPLIREGLYEKKVDASSHEGEAESLEKIETRDEDKELESTEKVETGGEDKEAESNEKVETEGEDKEAESNEKVETGGEDKEAESNEKVETESEDKEAESSEKVETGGEDKEAESTEKVETGGEDKEAVKSEKVETGGEDTDAKRNEKLDRLYEEFSTMRYWIHLRRFLHDYHVESKESLVTFFKEHGHVDFDGALFKTVSNIPEFMIDNRDVVCDETKHSLQENNKANVIEMKGNDSLCGDEGNKDKKHDDADKSSCDQLNENNAEEGDKICTKRRQQDICEEGLSEDSEVEKSSALHSKRPRHNPLLEKNCSESSDTKNNKESDFDISFSDQDDVTLDSVKVDSDDKENSDLTILESTKNTKKSSKHKKKKKMSSRHAGVAWVVKYFGKADGDKEETDEEKRDEEKEELSPTSPSEDNIFSVADSHGCTQKANCMSFSQGTKDVSIGQLDGLTSADYQFRADRLNLKEDFTKLSKCFDLQEDSSLSNSEHGKEIELSFNPTSTAGCVGADGTSGRNFPTSNNEKKKREKRGSKRGTDNGKRIVGGVGDDNARDVTEAVAMKSATQSSFWFIPNALPAMKNFLVMCASHLLTIIIPSVSGGTGLSSSGIQTRFPLFRKVLGFFRSEESPVKRKRKVVCQKRLESWLQQVSDSGVCPTEDDSFKEFYVQHEEREVQTVYQSIGVTTEQDGISYVTVNTLDLQNYCHPENTEWDIEKDWRRMHITFDDDGNPVEHEEYAGYFRDDDDEMDAQQREKVLWRSMISNHRFISYKMNDEVPPTELPKHLHKYWAQRHRLFLRYDEGIKLDEESWYSVTPEMLAAHHAYRCKCDVVIDAFCGSGGNAIQLASTCNHVIAIDVDPAKIELARHNAAVYGVEDCIEFIVGDFFQLAPLLKADVVFLSPPWGGTEYLHEKVYNVKKLGGAMDCEEIMTAAKLVTKNIALYLPRSSDLCQVIELAGLDGSVDLEYNYMGKKKKALTAYFGDLVDY